MKIKILVLLVTALAACGGPFETLGDRDQRADGWTRHFDRIRAPGVSSIFSATAPDRGGDGGLSIEAARTLDKRCPNFVHPGQNSQLATMRCAYRSVIAAGLPMGLAGKLMGTDPDDKVEATAIPSGSFGHGTLRDQARFRARQALDWACPRTGGRCTRTDPRYGAGEFSRGASAAPANQTVAPGEPPLFYEGVNTRCRTLGCGATGEAAVGSDGSLIQIARRKDGSIVNVSRSGNEPAAPAVQQTTLDKALEARKGKP